MKKISFENIRANAEFTQEQLALKMKVSQQAISKWESGKSKPKTKDIKKLATILNVNVEQILECFE